MTADTGVHAEVWLQLTQPELGQAVRLVREVAGGISMDALGARLHRASGYQDDGNVSVSTIWRWEAGATDVGLPYRRLLALVSRQISEELTDAMKRREFLQGLAKLAGLTLTVPTPVIDVERLAYVGRIDRSTVEGLAALTRTYGTLRDTVSPATLAPAVGHHVDQLVEISDRPSEPTMRREVERLLARSAVLDGWLSFNRQNMDTALQQWTLAYERAGEIGDPVLQAYALACRSRVYSRLHRGELGDPVVSRALLDQAVTLGAHGSAGLRSWLHANRAQVVADLGIAHDAERDLDEAVRLAEDSHGPQEELCWTQWDPVRADGYRATTALTLHRAPDAIAILEDARARTDPSVIPARCLHLADLSNAYAQQGDADHACELLIEAVQVSREAGFAEGMHRCRSVRAASLAGLDTPAVRELDEQLRSG